MKLKNTISRLFRRKPGVSDGADHTEAPTFSPELRADAAEVLRDFFEENETLFNRASRFEEKAERLDDGDGETSESAVRIAERARAEILAGLSVLRESFASTRGEEGRAAFDTELAASHPRFAG